MPAEWAPQKRIWLSWPHAKADWPGKFAPIPWVFAEIVRVITGSGQRVGLLMKDTPRKKRSDRYADAGRGRVGIGRYAGGENQSCWLRDCGPIWVKNPYGEYTALNWKFTGWAKYGNHKLDNLVPDAIADFTQQDSFEPTGQRHPDCAGRRWD